MNTTIPAGLSGQPPEAQFWQPIDSFTVMCLLCPRKCIIASGSSGACGARYNIEGKLYSANYGRACMGIDPVEKKPLYHWKPGSNILSLGSAGCNLFCPFCQNAHLSRSLDLSGLSPVTKEQVVHIATEGNIPSVAFTYNEPTVWFEFVVETSELLKMSGISVVLVTNGYISKEPLEHLLPFTDAMNIDLKAFSEESYQKIGGTLEPVLESIERAFRKGVHVEITHLVVPGINDSMKDFDNMVAWISSISSGIPLHISRYFPAYKWGAPPTPPEEIEKRILKSSKTLKYVYAGNLQGNNNTECPNCGETVIERGRYSHVRLRLDPDGACPRCKTPMGIVLR